MNKIEKDTQEGLKALADTCVGFGQFLNGLTRVIDSIDNINKDIEKEIKKNKD